MAANRIRVSAANKAFLLGVYAAYFVGFVSPFKLPYSFYFRNTQSLGSGRAAPVGRGHSFYVVRPNAIRFTPDRKLLPKPYRKWTSQLQYFQGKDMKARPHPAFTAPF